jgi:anti-sigma factor RsiW
MLTLACLWSRPRLERHADGALGARMARLIAAHLGHCGDCRERFDREVRLKALVHSSIAAPPEPDWGEFWPAVRARIAREMPRPVRDPWWAPLWKPVWGHPRLAISGVMAVVLAVVLAVVPGREGQVPSAMAAPVVVQDVGTPDPNRSVMVYSTPDRTLTVIWLFDSETEES